MEKNFTLPIHEDKFFRSYIELIKPFLNKITNKEADILGELLRQNYIKREIKNKSDRFKLILESNNRRAIEERLEINSNTLRNNLTSLKTKGILDDNNHVKDIYLIMPDGNFKLCFNFKLKRDE